MNRSLTLLAALLLLTSSFIGCKSRDPSRKKANMSLSKEAALQKIANSKINCTYFSARGKGKFESPSATLGFSYKINIAWDSLIWMSVTKLGYEGLRVRIDKDSIFMKITDQKTVMKCGIDKVSDWIGIEADFGLLQDMLTGSPHFIGNNIEMMEKGASSYFFSENTAAAKLDWEVHGGHFKTLQLNAKDRIRNKDAKLTYKNFIDVDGNAIPYGIWMEITGKDGGTLRFDHSDVVLDGDNVSFRFKKPKSYATANCENFKF